MSDAALRVMTGDGSLRAMGLDATRTVRGIVEAQDARPDVARIFGQLVCGAVLVRETMAPDHRVQAILKNAAGGSLVGDSHPGGMTRGLVGLARDVDVSLGGETLLQVIRVMRGGELQTGTVATEDGHGLSASFATYMKSSEQVTSAIHVGCLIEDGVVARAGGIIAQMLPDADDTILGVVTEDLEALPDIEELLDETGADPELLVANVLGRVGYRILDDHDVFFGCNCDEQRVLGSLATLGPEEIEQIVADAEVLEIDCDYCGAHYSIGPELLKKHL